MKEFFERHFGRILFIVITALVTVMAIVSNRGYGNFFQMTTDRGTSHTYYRDNDTYNRNRSNRQPWTMQKPSSSHSSKSSSKSSSSGHK